MTAPVSSSKADISLRSSRALHNRRDKYTHPYMKPDRAVWNKKFSSEDMFRSANPRNMGLPESRWGLRAQSVLKMQSKSVRPGTPVVRGIPSPFPSRLDPAVSLGGPFLGSKFLLPQVGPRLKPPGAFAPPNHIPRYSPVGGNRFGYPIFQNRLAMPQKKNDVNAAITGEANGQLSNSIKSKRKKKKTSGADAAPKRPWNARDAELALKAEHEYKNLKGNYLVLIRFPDDEVNANIVRSFHPLIKSVHFQAPCGPRYCFVQLLENVDVNKVVADLNTVKFQGSYIKAELKEEKEDNVVPEVIDPYTLYLGNLPHSITASAVKDMFKKATRVDIGFAQKLRFTRYAFIRFANVQNAIEAYKENVNMVLENRSVVLRFRRGKGTINPPGTSCREESLEIDERRKAREEGNVEYEPILSEDEDSEMDEPPNLNDSLSDIPDDNMSSCGDLNDEPHAIIPQIKQEKYSGYADEPPEQLPVHNQSPTDGAVLSTNQVKQEKDGCHIDSGQTPMKEEEWYTGREDREMLERWIQYEQTEDINVLIPGANRNYLRSELTSNETVNSNNVTVKTEKVDEGHILECNAIEDTLDQISDCQNRIKAYVESNIKTENDDFGDGLGGLPKPEDLRIQLRELASKFLRITEDITKPT